MTPLRTTILSLAAITLAFLASCTPTPVGDAHPGVPSLVPIEIFFFYEEYCASCEIEFSIHEVFHEVAADIAQLYPYNLSSLNVARISNRNLFEELIEQHQPLQEDADFPFLMIGSKLFSGEENIRDNLREAFIAEGEEKT